MATKKITLADAKAALTQVPFNPITPAKGSNDEDPIKLGDQIIEGWEAPEELPFEIYKAYIIQDFPGGHRDVQLNGIFNSIISWAGTMVGDLAEDRAQTLEFLSSKEEEIELKWRSFWRKGVIVRFRYIVRHAWEVDYEIDFVVTEAVNNGGTPTSASSEAQVQWSFQQAKESLEAPKAIELQQFKTPINDLEKLVEANIKQSNGTISNIDTNFRLSMAVGAANISAAMKLFMAPSYSSATSFTAREVMTYLGVVENVLRQTDQTYSLYPVQDPVFPKIATLFYNDASLWIAIARENQKEIGKIDTMAKGYFVLRIPTNPKGSTKKEIVYK